LKIRLRSPRYTILIANRKTGVVRRLTVTRLPAIAVAVSVMAIPILIGLAGFGAREASLVQMEALRLANDNLKVENDSYRQATGELATEISSLQGALTQLSDKADLDPATRAAIEKLPAVIRSRAMGGAVPAGLGVASAASPAAASPGGTFGVLQDLLGVLENRLSSVRSQVESQEALARATPSTWPIVAGWLSSGFGTRSDPFTGQPEFHAGLDISADNGAPVHATADGTITMASYDGNYGNCVMIDHGFGISTRFGHLSGFAVTVGQKVKRGQVIGYVGSTGRATGSHVHYEILINGRPVNPLRFLARP
jgi:murein DD-endopeptidase MepM/ murein hydrolase activator NlpD